MSPTVVTFLFEAANFLSLAAVLGYFFFKPVRKALQAQREKFEAESRLAAQKLEDAEKVQAEITALRANLKLELQQRKTVELAQARQQAEQILAEARAAAEQERKQGHRLAVQMSELQQQNLAAVASAAAGYTVGQLLEQIDGPDLQTALIRSACEQLNSMPNAPLSTVKIESQQRLTSEQTRVIQNALGANAGKLDFRIVDGLGPGVRISTSHGLVDATASGLSQYARQALLKEMHRRSNNNNHSALENMQDG